MNLIQLRHQEHGRRIAIVDQGSLELVTSEFPSSYELFSQIISEQSSADQFIPNLLTGEKLDYHTMFIPAIASGKYYLRLIIPTLLFIAFCPEPA
jgi:hypothetical protein